MPGLVLTKHFIQRWIERVGNYPTQEAVMAFIGGSIKVQNGMDVTLEDGSGYRVLAIFWHPSLGLMIKVDEEENRAVTVLTRECWRSESDGESVIGKCKAHSRVPPARVAKVKEIFGKGLVFA